MTRVPLIKLCHRVPGFMRLGRAIPVHWYFNWIKTVAPLIGFFSVHAREQGRYVTLALATSRGQEESKSIARRNLIYRKWRVCLQVAWPNIASRYHEWVCLEGEEYLNQVCAAGRGAILLSGHSFGFSGMAVRTLAQRGHEIIRTGAGRNPERQRRRWGNGDFQRWQYLGYHGDYWHRFRVLKQLQDALKRKAVLHIGIRGLPAGNSEYEIDYCHGRFFLDPQILRLIEILQVPILPCFVLCDKNGRAVIKIFPAITPVAKEIAAGFGSLYAEYLRNFPENANIWKRVARGEEI